MIDDQQLVKDYLENGDETALEILVQCYLKLVYSFCFRLIKDKQASEDLSQEIFLKVWKNLKKFNPHKNRLEVLPGEKDQSFKVWLLSISRNACIDFLRKKKTSVFSEFDTDDGNNLILDILADSAPLPDAVYERQLLINKINSVSNKLSEKSRIVISLHYEKGLTFEEISKILGESLNTIKSRHQRALIKLRRFFVV